MHVHLVILDARESLAGLGFDPRDRIVARAGLPPSPRSKMALPVQIIDAPIMGQPMGMALAPDLADEIKHELTKRSKHRALEKYLLRLQVTKHGQWVGTIFVQLLCLAKGYVVERWVNMHPMKGVALGALRVRIVVRESAEDAWTVFHQFESIEPTDMTRSDGCVCDVCDPYNERLDEATKRDRLLKNERAVTDCAVM